MNREFRREAARREERRVRRQAKLHAVRLLRRLDGAEEDEPEADLDRWPFPCAHACGTCGRLEWMDATAGDPLRRAADERAIDRACPHCGKVSWIDLASKPMSAALVESEVFEARCRTSSFRWALRDLFWGGVFVAPLAYVGVASSSLGGWSSPGGLAALGLSAGALAIAAGARLVRAIRDARGGRTLPRRWSMVPRPRGKLREAAMVRPATAPLSAPLSGRRCFGYEVAIRWNDAIRARPSTWALVEQRVCDLELGGVTVLGTRVHLDLPRERVELSASSVSENALRWLRARGLDLTDGALVVCESILEAGDSLEVRWEGDLSSTSDHVDGVIVRRVSAAGRG